MQQHIQQLEKRIYALEIQPRTPAATNRKSKRPKHKIEPVEMWPFIARHEIGRDEKIDIVMGQLRPFKRDNDTDMLDAHGQRAFWQIFNHTTPTWRDCPDCLHEKE